MLGWKDSQAYWFNHLFEKNWQAIRDEAKALYASGKFYDHSQSEENTASTSPKIANHWKIFSVKHQPALAPVTWNLVKLVPEILSCKDGLYYFSLIPSGGVVLPHRSLFEPNARHRHQLCLEVPIVNPSDEVYFQISGEKRTWELGKVMSFDDAFTHDVKNLSQGSRLVFLYDSLPL